MEFSRAFLWSAAFLAVLGNIGSLIARVTLHTENVHTSFHVLVTNLGIADFLMGVYLTIIGAADQYYRGR
jgi:hypothetical protein